MIFDTAKNLDFYKKLGIEDRYSKAVEFLKTADLENLPVGRYEIDGSNVFANVAEYDTLPWEESFYETHEKYTDIQYVIKGTEIMTFAQAEHLTPSGPFNEERDVINYTNDYPGIRFTITAGGYMIFRPGEGHKSKTMVKASERIKKIVVKIKEV